MFEKCLHRPKLAVRELDLLTGHDVHVFLRPELLLTLELQINSTKLNYIYLWGDF